MGEGGGGGAESKMEAIGLLDEGGRRVGRKRKGKLM